METTSLIKKPLAWIPLVLPLGIMAMLGFYLLKSNGVLVPEADEGTAAHLFQLWIPTETVLIMWFGLTWMSREPRAATPILLVQIILSLLPLTTVFYFNL